MHLPGGVGGAQKSYWCQVRVTLGPVDTQPRLWTGSYLLPGSGRP